MILTVFLWGMFFSLILLLFKLTGIYKNYLISVLITLFIVIFVVKLKMSINYVLEGGKLWITAIIPTLFPFSILCNLLIIYDGIDLYSKFIGPLLCLPLKLSKKCSFPLAASFLCGYPLGAVYSADIYKSGHIAKPEYNRLVNIASNCSPLFIIGPVGTIMLGNIQYGYLLLIANYLSVIFIGLFTKKSSGKFTKNNIPKKAKIHNFGQSLKIAIENAIKTTVTVGGFIVIFSVVIGLIKESRDFHTAISFIEHLLNVPDSSVYSAFLGIIEITNGCSLISQTSLPLNYKLSIVSFLCSFSGLSIIAQVSSILSSEDVSIIRYSFIKLCQGIISFIITFFISGILFNIS